MQTSRREFLRGLGAGVALAAVPAGFVRLASGLVVPEEEAIEREAHRRIWQVGAQMGVVLSGETVDGRDLHVTMADGRVFQFASDAGVAYTALVGHIRVSAG